MQTRLARSVRDFLDTAPARMEWLVDSLLPAHGLLLVVAPQRTGKTMLLLDLVTAVASGQPFLSRPTQRGRTLYVMLEGPAASLAERYRRLAAHRSLDDCHVVHGHDVRAQSEAWEQLLADVELLRPALVVVDTYARVLPIGADENSARDVGAIAAALDRLVRLGPAVVVVHHVAKNSDATGGGAARGSSALPAAADGTWVLRGHGPDRLKLTSEMRDAEPRQIQVSIDWETGVFTPLGDTEPGGVDAAQPRPPSGITPAALRDLAILSAHGIDTAAVRARYRCSDTTALKALRGAVEAGVLAEAGPGNHRRYVPAA